MERRVLVVLVLLGSATARQGESYDGSTTPAFLHLLVSLWLEVCAVMRWMGLVVHRSPSLDHEALSASPYKFSGGFVGPAVQPCSRERYQDSGRRYGITTACARPVCPVPLHITPRHRLPATPGRCRVLQGHQHAGKPGDDIAGAWRSSPEPANGRCAWAEGARCIGGGKRSCAHGPCTTAPVIPPSSSTGRTAGSRRWCVRRVPTPRNPFRWQGLTTWRNRPQARVYGGVGWILNPCRVAYEYWDKPLTKVCEYAPALKGVRKVRLWQKV
jgi:hypothetical protein